MEIITKFGRFSCNLPLTFFPSLFTAQNLLRSLEKQLGKYLKDGCKVRNLDTGSSWWLGGRESVKGLILLNIENIEKIEIDGAITEHR